ncbi:hypothetical protein ACFL4D_01305 [Candidatus Margulisiibacteriota bacterium]
MSTEKRNVSAERISQLARLNDLVFHSRDLAALWQISNTNTLYTTLKRYCQNGILFRIQNGLYSLVPPDKLDPVLLGLKVIHKYAYLTLETILFQEGVINQPSSYITFAGPKPISFQICGQAYKCRQLQDRYLFQPIGVEDKKGVLTASVERAVADSLYFNPDRHFDAPHLVNWSKVQDIQKEIGYHVTSPA